ncbi:MAG: choice-of-anchor J domain-containing protein [Bacteroides sp.]|nr:choice-of-anchor J domain-containing protein [Bacteroides sp.]MCM1379339.1 choice-of-anchor J domain-containing protein [Bacteroides sp.]MCM1445002.1 choice-of-anchor J domain-containing protein [Prevotella sp.]
MINTQLRKSTLSRAAIAALLIVCTSAANAAQRKLPGSNTVLAGAMVYNDLWGAVDQNGNYTNPITSGIYTFGARADASPKCVYRNDKMLKMRAGVKVNSIYYTISTSNYDSEAYLTTYYASSWSQRSEEEIDLVNVPSDLTYDPVSGNVYGFFYNESTQEYSQFGRFDTYYGEAEIISDVDRNAFAIAANKNGEIYGIWGYTGWLIKVDPKTGRYEQIGKTGFSPAYINSLTFDDATGKLYWCANDAEGYSALLEVDTTTGAATEICHFENNASFAGIYAMPYTIPDAAPAAVSEAKINFPTIGAVTGTVECVAPVKTYNGATLSGPLTVVINVVGGQTYEIANVQPGSKVTSGQITFAEGPVTVEITTATADYMGESVSIESWAGEDVPGAPTDVTLSDDNGVPVVSWTAPTVGMNNGLFNPSSLTYTVKRLNDGKTFSGITATTFRDDTFSGMASLQYEVTAVNSKGSSPATVSPAMVFGEGFTVPFTEGFDSATAFSLWTVTDLNGSTTWEYDSNDKQIFYSYGKTVEVEGDDWIVSPRFKLQKDVTYALTFDAKTYYASYPENFKFALGSSTNPASMTQVIVDCPNYEMPKNFEHKRVLFSVGADGYYHLGLHCYSIAHNWQLNIDNIGIQEVSSSVPSAATELTVKAAPLGALSAEVAFTAPKVDAKGVEISDPMTIKIYRNQSAKAVHELAAVAPGSKCTWTDTDFDESGLYTYQVVCHTEAGEGSAASATAFVGVDVPGAVTNLRAIESADGTVALSWEAPTVGANGGYFDNSALTYRVVRSNDATQIYDGAETSFIDNTLHLTGQTLMYYLVTPYAGNVKGQYNNTSLSGVFGPAINAPFAETFPDADMTNYPWVSESDGSVYLWSLEASGLNPDCSDQNGDRGLAMFISTADTKGITGKFSSPKVNISGLETPVLSFWFYHSTDGEEDMSVLIMTDGGDFEPVKDLTLKQNDGTTGWKRYTADLTPYKASQYLRVMFAATAKGDANMMIDNVVIDESRGVDIAVTSLAIPSRIAAGHKAAVAATIANNGMETSAAVSLALTDTDGKQLAAKTLPALAAGESAAAEFEVVLTEGSHTLTLTATCSNDTYTANNANSIAVKAVEPVMPAPSALEGTVGNGTVTLTWAAPYAKGHVTDDVESYADWAIRNVGDYLLIDRDYDNTYFINKDLEEYPDMTSPKSFQICNAKTLGIDIWDEGTPHSGNKMFMSIACSSTVNNDWLISPQLNGKEQTISFYAKAFTAQDTPAERIRVLYSMGSTDPTDFVQIHSANYIEVPELWTEYRFVVPEGARRFAINCVSDDAFALFVDDLSFNDMTVPALEVSGYEVIRNGEVIAKVSGSTYVDTEAPAGTSTYQVRALFDSQLSALTESISVNVELDGIAEVEAYAVSIRPDSKGVEIRNAAGLVVEIYSLDGRRIFASEISEPTCHVALQPGLYAISVGTTTAKVLVK